MLEGPTPHRVVFPDHHSAEQHNSAVREGVAKLLEKGAVQKWQGPEPPTVINGLRVVEQPGKLRLCINPMYGKLFMRYSQFKYERLADMKDYLRRGDWLYTTDDKQAFARGTDRQP